MGAEATATHSREVVLEALGHHEPARLPVDFGGTIVTGMHVSVVAGLREHYGLERRPVKLLEPFQMLGLIEEDLKQALGIDTEGVVRRRTIRVPERELEAVAAERAGGAGGGRIRDQH